MPETNDYNMGRCIEVLGELGFERVGALLEFKRSLRGLLNYQALRRVSELMELLGYETEYIVIGDRSRDNPSPADRMSRTVRGVRYVHVAN